MAPHSHLFIEWCNLGELHYYYDMWRTDNYIGLNWAISGHIGIDNPIQMYHNVFIISWLMLLFMVLYWIYHYRLFILYNNCHQITILYGNIFPANDTYYPSWTNPCHKQWLTGTGCLQWPQQTAGTHFPMRLRTPNHWHRSDVSWRPIFLNRHF